MTVNELITALEAIKALGAGDSTVKVEFNSVFHDIIDGAWINEKNNTVEIYMQ